MTSSIRKIKFHIFSLLVLLLGSSAFASGSYQVICTELNRANPNVNPRQYTVQMELNDPAHQAGSSKISEKFQYGTAKILRQELSRADSSVIKSTTLITEIPCVQAKDSPSISCVLDEKLSRGRFSTAKFHLKVHSWEFLRWKEGAESERETPLLVKSEEVHFFIENQRFRNNRGERQPIVLTKRFRKANCKILD